MALAALIVRIGADLSDLNKGLTQVDRDVQKLGKSMQQAGQRMSTYLTLPLVGVGVAATKMASDAAEAANKFDVVMGPSAARLRGEFAALHRTIPLATHEMESLAAGVQDMLVPMGVARAEGAEMSLMMVRLAADIGSFNNQNPARVLEAMQSALAGSSEPMRRFGVDTREAALEAIALSAGLVRAGEKMDMTARAQAVLLAIQKDSTDAMGDAARTAAEAANQFKFFARDARELAVSIGTHLLPVVAPLVGYLSSSLRVFGELSPAVQRLVVALGVLVAAAGPLLMIIGKLLTMLPLLKLGFAALTGPVGLLVTGLGALTAAWIATRKATDDAKNAVGGFSATLAGMDTKGMQAELRRTNYMIALIENRAPVDTLLGPMVPLATPAQVAVLESLRKRQEQLTAALKETGRVATTTARGIKGIKDHLDEIATLGRAVALGLGDTSAITRLNAAERELRRQAMETNRTYAERVELMEAANRASRDLFSYLTQRSPVAALSRTGPAGSRTGGLLPGGVRPVGRDVRAINERTSSLGVAGGGGIGAISRFADGVFAGVAASVKGLIASFGPLAVAAALLAPVFQGLREVVGPALQALMEPLREIGRATGAILVPVMEALAEPMRLLGSLVATMLAPIRMLVQLFLAVTPAFRLLGAALGGLVIALSYLHEAIGWVVRGIGRLVDMIPGISARSIIRAGQEMIDGARAARRGMDAAASAADRLAGALSNVPRVLNVAALRNRVASGAAPGPPAPPRGPRGGGGTGAPPGPGGGGGGGDRDRERVVVYVQNVNGVVDAAAFLDEMGRLAQRARSRGGTVRLATA